MPSSPLPDLLKLPADDRAELAMALWDSLSEDERDRAFDLTEQQRAELDRRWSKHLEHPGAAVPWADVRAKLVG